MGLCVAEAEVLTRSRSCAYSLSLRKRAKVRENIIDQLN